MNLIPDWYIGLGGTLLLLKDIPLFYSLKKVPSSLSSAAHVDNGVPFFHRAILVSVSIVLMLVLWEKSTELRVGMADMTSRIALAVLYTFLYWATRIPALVVEICEARNYKLLQIAISYIAVLIFQMLMLY